MSLWLGRGTGNVVGTQDTKELLDARQPLGIVGTILVRHPDDILLVLDASCEVLDPVRDEPHVGRTLAWHLAEVYKDILRRIPAPDTVADELHHGSISEFEEVSLVERPQRADHPLDPRLLSGLHHPRLRRNASSRVPDHPVDHEEKPRDQDQGIERDHRNSLVWHRATLLSELLLIYTLNLG